MRKVILFFLLIFSFSFSWEKIIQKDDFGDNTNIYMLKENFININAWILIGKNENDIICGFEIKNADFEEEDVKIKVKSRHKGKDFIQVLEAKSFGDYVVFYPDSRRRLLIAFRDSDVVKFNLNGKPFSISAKGFTHAYKNAYWQDFDNSKEIKMPPKGNKVWSIYEGEGNIEEQDAIF